MSIYDLNSRCGIVVYIYDCNTKCRISRYIPLNLSSPEKEGCYAGVECGGVHVSYVFGN